MISEIPNAKVVVPLLVLLPLAVSASATGFFDWIGPQWTWLLTGAGLVAVTVAIFFVDRQTRVLDQRRRAGHCPCGFDLRATPPKDVSVHSFDVDERMSSTKKTIVCPECGREEIVWEENTPAVPRSGDDEP